MFENPLKWLVAATIIYTVFSCGETAATKHPVKQSPHQALPSIQVRAFYPGADAGKLLDSVSAPLKDAFSQYAGNMDHITYTANIDGSFIVTVYFKPGIDLDSAATGISNVVAVASPQLPSPVVQSGVTVTRQNESIVMAVGMYAEDTGSYDQAFLVNYTATNIVPGIRGIPGVSHLITFNKSKDSVMRIWLNEEHMAAAHLTLKEILTAIPAGQLDAVTGMFYKKSKSSSDYIIKCSSKHNQPAEYGNMVIRKDADTILRWKDVATKIEFGPYTYGNFSRINGKPGVNIVVMQWADSNYSGIQPAVEKVMETASAQFPVGIKHVISYNPKDSLYISAE
ncbi:multidrug efflux pump subunit AcrB [Chitinophaga sp. W3I9]|uniref:efflux RND transporter permease subunit n=1 Tax=Chitinophaga sp. W3I9 TaxID=3373924 RepID=UPI003D1D99AE